MTTALEIKSTPVIATTPVTTIELEWARDGNFFYSRSRADKTKRIPGGIYRYQETLMGWRLERYADNFEFTFKVYPAACEKILNRIVAYWQANPNNLGVLMNGLRGAGKTMAAQLLANRLIEEENLPVLVVREPVTLQNVLDAASRENMMVIFDEFEKTHDAENQQKLLTTIDGMSRSSAKRLFLFTTNTDEENESGRGKKGLDENFKDRPSRIRYRFEFNRVADAIIEGLIDDSLPADLKHFKSDIVSYLDSRNICTIDIVKAVISEVATFRESPLEFDGLLNIAKSEPPAFKIMILNPETGEVQKLWKSYFKPMHDHQVAYFTENKAVIENFEARDKALGIASASNEFAVTLLKKCPEPGVWLAWLATSIDETPFRMFTSFCYGSGSHFYYDTPPEDWSFPYTAEMARDDSEIKDKVESLFYAAEAESNIHGTAGTDKRIVFKIKIEPNRERVETNYRVSSWKG